MTSCQDEQAKCSYKEPVIPAASIYRIIKLSAINRKIGQAIYNVQM